MSFHHLSTEMVVYIFSLLHYVDLQSCRRVNKAFNQLIRSSSLLQYSMQLQIAGYVDNPSSNLVICDKLRSLREQERAWQRLDFEKPTPIRLPFPPSSIYELSDGIFLLGQMSLSLEFGTDVIRWTRLSELAKGNVSDAQWGRISVGAHIIDVGLSVQEHDLVVVATDRESDEEGDNLTIFELHLIQLSTGLSHPLASKPIIKLATIPTPSQPLIGQCSVCIETVGDLLGFMFHYPSGSTTPCARFEVYDWKKGECLQVRGIDCPNYSTFTFLAPDVIALPDCERNTIELCKIGQRPISSSPLTLEPACVLQMPKLERGRAIAQVTCRSEPKTTRTTPHASAFRSKEPFHVDPERTIVIFNVMTHNEQGFHECLTLVAHTASLLAIVNENSQPHHIMFPLPFDPPFASTSRSDSAEGPCTSDPPRIEWDRWGPRACRFLETSFGASRWITTTCGQRYVTVEDDGTEDNPATIIVYDFNPHTVRRLAACHRKRRRRRHRARAPEGEEGQQQQEQQQEHQQQLQQLPAIQTAAGLDPGGAIVNALARLDSVALIPFTDRETKVIGQIQCEPTFLTNLGPDYRVFEDPIHTGLPYVQLSSYETFGYGAVLLDRNVVIGVKLNDADDIHELVIHSIRTGQ